MFCQGCLKSYSSAVSPSQQRPRLGAALSEVDVAALLLDNGCTKGNSPRERSPVPLRTVSGRAFARTSYGAAALTRPTPHKALRADERC